MNQHSPPSTSHLSDFPQELIESIVALCHDDKITLFNACCISRIWVYPTRRFLFHTLAIWAGDSDSLRGPNSFSTFLASQVDVNSLIRTLNIEGAENSVPISTLTSILSQLQSLQTLKLENIKVHTDIATSEPHHVGPTRLAHRLSTLQPKPLQTLRLKGFDIEIPPENSQDSEMIGRVISSFWALFSHIDSLILSNIYLGREDSGSPSLIVNRLSSIQPNPQLYVGSLVVDIMSDYSMLEVLRLSLTEGRCKGIHIDVAEWDKLVAVNKLLLLAGPSLESFEMETGYSIWDDNKEGFQEQKYTEEHPLFDLSSCSSLSYLLLEVHLRDGRPSNNDKSFSYVLDMLSNVQSNLKALVLVLYEKDRAVPTLLCSLTQHLQRLEDVLSRFADLESVTIRYKSFSNSMVMGMDSDKWLRGTLSRLEVRRVLRIEVIEVAW